MLDNLVGVIETLQGRIHDHSDVLRQNEIRTRVALIDPLLQALGWDVADPGLATPEYEISGQRVDYALLGAEGKPAATVEAKKLGENLAAHRMQMLNYSNAAGIAYAGLTDGNQWELYEVFKQVSLEQRRLLDLRILDTPAHECALKLLLLWRPNLATGKPVAAAEPIVAAADLPATATPAAAVANPQPPASQTITPSIAEGWVRLSDCRPETGSKPPAIHLPGGEEKQLDAWTQVIYEVAEHLIKAGSLTADRCPIQVAGGTRHVVHTVAVHSNGRNFGTAHKLSNGLFCEGDVSGVSVITHAKTLLQHCGVDAGAVGIKLG